MSWNNIPDVVKKHIFLLTGGFRAYHEPLFKKCIRSIERRYSDYVCYICGLQNSFLRCGLTRNPSTRMYVKKNDLTVEVFGKCCKHTDGPLSVDGVLIPRSVETVEQLYKFIGPLFPEANQVFMFTTHEDYRSGWRIIDREKSRGSFDTNGSNSSSGSNGIAGRTRSQSSLVP